MQWLKRRNRWRDGPRCPDVAQRRLTFAPLAWLKLQFLCHAGPTEVAAFGLSAAEDPLYLDDVLVVRQRATSVGVAFEDAAVADLFDVMTDAGVSVGRYARIWVHTHPGSSVVPSDTDEMTFARAFGACDWAVMAILGRTGQTSARLRFAAGPGGAIELPVAVDWAAWPVAASDPDRPLAVQIADWQREYAMLVEVAVPLPPDAMLFDDPWAENPAALHAVEELAPSDPFLQTVMTSLDPDLADRDLRQRDLVPPARLARCHAVVIGVGSVGRQAALQLAAAGVPAMTLYDPDAVEVKNLAVQGFWETDVGDPKVDAVANVCHQQFPRMDLRARRERFRKSTLRTWPRDRDHAVFVCVDDIATRKLIWDAVRATAGFLTDGRMAAEVVRVLASDRPATDGAYPTTLFAAGEGFVGSCTSKSTIYAASVAAGLMVGQFARWLRGLPVVPDQTLNLLAAELTVADTAY